MWALIESFWWLYCLQEMEVVAAKSSIPLRKEGGVDYSQDFFGEKAFLTVSGQLNGEM
jgi:asparaginyl-tRNA synthetase